MLKKSAICYMFAALGLMCLPCCNSDYVSTSEAESSSTVISSFSLNADDSVMVGLDTVFFSIDLVQARIFNAEPLPYGTRTSALVIKISTPENIASCEVTMSRAGKSDTTINYLTNSTDSIDFSQGPATVRIVSPNGNIIRDYKVWVNVSPVKSDSLVWERTERRSLPSRFAVPNRQCTVEQAGKWYCLTAYQGAYCMASADDPGAEQWQLADVTIPFTPQIETLTATDDALYMLADDATLYRSTDGGSSWSDCGIKADYLYGGYTTELLASQKRADGWYRISYPGMKVEAITEPGFPVSGASRPVAFNLPMMTTPQILIAGGVLADGTVTGNTWAYDGSTWVCLTQSPLTEARVGAVIVPYMTHRNADKYWVAGNYATLLCIGGADAQGVPVRNVCVSNDWGVNWRKADDLLQLPEYVPAMALAQGFVERQTLTSRSSVWTMMPQHPLPWWLEAQPMSRATRPIDEWECPFIYLFGGQSEQGTLYNTVWRAVINRYTFKPIF